MRRILFLTMLALSLALTGCTLAPKYVRPAAPVPAELAGGQDGQAVAELAWRDFFADARLKRLIEIALENNRDLRLAALNVERARAMYNIQRAELLPPVYGVATAARTHSPADLASSGRASTSESYSVNLGVISWEIDLFGRVQSLKDNALEQYLATDEARRGAQISLVASVAQAYLTLAADRENLKLADETLKAQQESYELIRKRYTVGLATELDLSRVQTQVDTARRDAARYTQVVASDENALNLLLGTVAPPELLPADLNGVSAPRQVAAGLSSEALLKRPDILQAEHRLKGAYANIGAARAALFPSISLTSTIGTASSELTGLFNSGSRTFNVSPQVSLPIFDARVWQAHRVSKVDREIALTSYEKAIQTAFKETADSLSQVATIDEQVEAQQSLLKAVEQTYRLSNARYAKGLDSYLSVLDAQRSLYGAQQGLVQLKLQKLASQVRLYAVLGGGAQ